MSDFLKTVSSRRTIYNISDKTSITEERIEEIVEESLLQTPTAFNSQSGRVILLFGGHHKKLWDITKEQLKKVTPPANFPKTEEKINSFARGCGTILYYEDQAVVKDLQERFALYKDNFPIWSEQGSGILQFVVWTALTAEGLGASLQHYNPLIDADVSKEFDVPENWKLIGQMPFGNIEAPAEEKSYLPVEPRLKVFK